MNYLKFIEFSAENLQFYLWFRDYSERFNKLPPSEKVLAPEWSQSQAEAEAAANTSSYKPSKRVDPQFSEVLQNSDFADSKPKATADRADPFDTPDKTPSLEEKRDALSEFEASTIGDKSRSTAHQSTAEQAFDDAGMKWKPCRYLSTTDNHPTD